MIAAAALAWSGCGNQSQTASDTGAATNAASAISKANASSAKKAEEKITRYEVLGVVQQVKTNESKIVIKHEAIPNYMAAMTMPFDYKSSNDVTGLTPGDQVHFTLAVTEDDGWVENIRKTGFKTNAPPEHQSVRRVRDVEPLEIGDVMPDYSFTNSFGKKISLSDYKGQALAFTFIFTRCPFPNFCPRMNKNFEGAYDILKEGAEKGNGPTNFHFISISFDPEFDTPERLKTYSETFHFDPAKWDFATGAMIDIDAITEQFGLYFAYDKGNFDHNLRTVVIDAAGKVAYIFIGNEWKPEELAAEMAKAAVVK